MTQPRPIQHLNTLLKLYPGTPKHVDQLRTGQGKDLPQWPAWCFLPMAGWYAIASAELKVNRLPIEIAGDVSKLAAIGTWRYSQGIYQIDPHLLSALTDSTVSGTLPSEVFFRLPEWCIYIETPNMRWMGDTLHGFWAHLEWDANTTRNELRLLLDCEQALIGLPLHLGAWTITEAVDRAIGEATKQAQQIGISHSAPTDLTQQTAEQINPLISMLLYICSDEPEIDDLRVPGVSPSKPTPKKTKKGWKLFPPDKPRLWTIGATTGAKLQQANEHQPTGRTVRSHLRRGHWHGFWVGPRTGERKFTYRWLSPLIVGGSE